MKKILILLTLLLLISCFVATAQVPTNFNNKILVDAKGQFGKPYKNEIDFEVTSRNPMMILRNENKNSDSIYGNQPFQIAVPVPVNLDIVKLMAWDYDKSFAYGKFVIKLTEALSSSINFDKFYLPKGTEMYLYNENGNMVMGPITEKENNPNGIWGSWVLLGPILIVEIKTPISTFKDIILHVNNVAYGYKEVYKKQVAGFGQSATCEINVVCPIGDGWENERNSVSLILSDNGSSLCSGCLVMNTCNTNQPFYLTGIIVFTMSRSIKHRMSLRGDLFFRHGVQHVLPHRTQMV